MSYTEEMKREELAFIDEDFYLLSDEAKVIAKRIRDRIAETKTDETVEQYEQMK